MSRNVGNHLRLATARSLLLMAAALLLLFLGNLRSRYIYGGTNFSYIFSLTFSIPCAYCFLAGIGLLKLKKWALLLLFCPGILLIAVYLDGSGARVPMPWALIDYAILAMLIGFPAYMLRYWNTFKWR
jgi:hypothetical protein